ncbi:NUDIX domain-containing protein [Streptomyces sp. NPDC000941]
MKATSRGAIRRRPTAAVAVLAATAALALAAPSSSSAQQTGLRAYGITSDGTRMATFTTDRPQTLDWVQLVTGLSGDTTLIAIDDGRRRVVLVEDDFYLQGRRVLHLPGGGVGGQDPREAAARELEEETGFIASELRPLGVIDPLPATTRARTHLFVATCLRNGTIHRDDTEIGMTVHWWDVADAVEAVREGRITEAGSVTALLLAGLGPIS